MSPSVRSCGDYLFLILPRKMKLHFLSDIEQPANKLMPVPIAPYPPRTLAAITKHWRTKKQKRTTTDSTNRLLQVAPPLPFPRIVLPSATEKPGASVCVEV